MFKHAAGALFAVTFSILLAAPAAQAQSREKLGYGRLLSNDFFGDGHDRWRTGSWTSSRVWGPEWTGRAPKGFGELIELRLSAEIFAPENIARPAAGDRPYAGALSAGIHTHFDFKGFEMAVGGDVTLTGSGNGLGDFQDAVHDLLGAREPSNSVLDDQIGGGLHLTVVGEIGRTLQLADNLRFRPFVEGRAGAEDLVRAGFDFTFGRVGADELLVRESVTGHRYRVVQNPGVTGFSFLMGADIAHVADSIYLPEGRDLELTDSRERLRAGVQWQGHRASAFYGVTYLGEEFEAQTEGQVTGSLQVKFRF